MSQDITIKITADEWMVVTAAIAQFGYTLESHMNAAAQDKAGRRYKPGAVQFFHGEIKAAQAVALKLVDAKKRCQQ